METIISFSSRNIENFEFVKKLNTIHDFMNKNIIFFHSSLSSKIINDEERLTVFEEAISYRCPGSKSCKLSIIDNGGKILPSLKVVIKFGKGNKTYEGVFMTTLIKDKGFLSILCARITGETKISSNMKKIHMILEQTLCCIITPLSLTSSDYLYWFLGICLKEISRQKLEDEFELEFELLNEGIVSLMFDDCAVATLLSSVHKCSTHSITRDEILDLKVCLREHTSDVYGLNLSGLKFVSIKTNSCSIFVTKDVHIICKVPELMFNIIAFFETLINYS